MGQWKKQTRSGESPATPLVSEMSNQLWKFRITGKFELETRPLAKDDRGYTGSSATTVVPWPNSEVTLSVTKAGYATFETQISVGQQPPVYDPNLACVQFEQGSVRLSRNKPNDGANIKIKTEGCSQPILVRLDSELELSKNTVAIGRTGSAEVSVLPRPAPGEPYSLGIGEYYIDLFAKFEGDPPEAGYVGPLQTLPVFITDNTSCFRMVDPQDNSQEKFRYDLRGGEDSGVIFNDCFQFYEDLQLPRMSILQVNPENIISLRYGLPELPPDKWEDRIKEKVGSYSLEPGEENAYTFPITDTGGYVFLEWIDLFMTDTQHPGTDLHRISVQTFPGVWTNITAFVPYTSAGGGVPGPVVSNEGWIDTETYYPQGLASGYGTASKITSAPVWQGQHNVCNRNIGSFGADLGPCSAPGYFGGQSVVPYRAGVVANRVKIEAVGETTTGTGIKYRYINKDPNHQGRIDFDLTNNGLLGDTYALLEVEDSVTGSGVVSGATAFNWVLTATGYTDEVEEIPQLDQPIVVPPGKALVVSTDPSADQKSGLYASLEEGGAALGRVAIDLNAFRFRGAFSKPITYKITYYTNNEWCSGEECERERAEVALEPVSGVFDWNFGEPSSVSAIAIVNTNDENEFTIEKAVLDRYIVSTVSDQTQGSATIGVGEMQVVFTPVPRPSLPAGNYTRVEYSVDDDSDDVITFFEDTGLSTTTSSAARVVGRTTSPVSAAVTKKEKFHIKLVGQQLNQCVGYNGKRGITGKSAKPRVLLSWGWDDICLLYTSPSPRDLSTSRMPSSA